MSMRFSLAVLAYAVPTFVLGFLWHLVLFKSYYAALAIYRNDIIVPFGLTAILIQAVVFAWIYQNTYFRRAGAWLRRGLIFAAVAGLLSWTFTTLAVSAKNLMASVPDYLLIETAFTAVQWIVVGPLIALAFSARAAVRDEPAPA